MKLSPTAIHKIQHSLGQELGGRVKEALLETSEASENDVVATPIQRQLSIADRGLQAAIARALVANTKE